MLHRGPPKEGKMRKVTPPSPSYMSNDQFAAYLADLRNNRVTRPSGARPQPPSMSSRLSRSSTPADLPGLPSHQRTGSDVSGAFCAQARRTPSLSSRPSMMSTQGRDYYPETPSAPLKPSEVVPSSTYIERGQRWMEKEEAVSLRCAMDEMDLDGKEERGEEERIHEAALNEAAELVWQHQNGYKPPPPGAPYRYKPHLRKNSYAYARTASTGRYGEDVAATGVGRDVHRSASGSSSDSDGVTSLRRRGSGCYAELPESAGLQRRGQSNDVPARDSLESTRSNSIPSQQRDSSLLLGTRRRSSMKRTVDGGVQRPFSGDQIWEEPDTDANAELPLKPVQPPRTDELNNAQPLQVAQRNPLNKPNGQKSEPSRARRLPWLQQKPIPAAQPPQSKEPQSLNLRYTTNERPSTPEQVSDSVPKKNGIEIRSEEIRQATGMKLKDRSAKLPTPTAVSDNPGRPIVSFDANWKAPEEATDVKLEETGNGSIGPGKRAKGSSSRSLGYDEQNVANISSAPQLPSIHIDGDGGKIAAAIPPKIIPVNDNPDLPGIPVIITPDCGPASNRSNCPPPSSETPSVPTIVTPDYEPQPEPCRRPLPTIEDASIPVIVTPDAESTSTASRRPLPSPEHYKNPHTQPRSRGHWSPAIPQPSRATASCHECCLPIEGRFVALAGLNERFHPQCFRCFACGTGLEALEISPEPENHRAERLDRIQRRARGEQLKDEPGKTAEDDGDDRLRFFCHLDWHELFAPRCKHCKTPILGEHIVALGNHWHYGHFFCAECGDPFEQGVTHIEKDGYAWCVNCQTKRTERRAPKCKKCKMAVIGQYIRALGGEWHDECFRCAICLGGFDDGQVFPREESGQAVVLCTRCRAIELKR